MKKGFLLLEMLIGIGIFLAVSITIGCCYMTSLQLMVRHKIRGEAVEIAEKQIKEESRAQNFSGHKADFSWEKRERFVLPDSRLKLVELRIYYAGEKEPVYNLFSYE